MIYYAIRHKPTGGFLPQGNKKRRGGFTNDEPVLATVRPPRLFMKPHHAADALRWWLEGRYYERIAPPSAPDLECSGDVELHCVEQPARKAEDMEIVPLTVLKGP